MIRSIVLRWQNQLSFATYSGTGTDQSKHVEHLESLLRSTNSINEVARPMRLVLRWPSLLIDQRIRAGQYY